MRPSDEGTVPRRLRPDIGAAWMAARAGQLAQLIRRAENAPLPASFRQLGESPYLNNDPRVQPLIDSLNDVERERDSFDAVTGVDPTFVALTARATEIGRAIQAIGEEKLATMRRQMAALRRAPSPAAPAFV